MSERRTPTMPVDVAQRLRAEFIALPPVKVRWKTRPGIAFLKRLADRADTYSASQCAKALGVSESTVYDWLNRRISSSGGHRWPQESELRSLRRAWRSMEGLRRTGRHAGRQTHEYEQVHQALTELLQTLDLAVLAAAMREPAQALKAFLPPPQLSAQDRADTAELIHLWQRAHYTRTPPSIAANAQFRAAVQQISTRMTPARIARALGLDLRDILAVLDCQESG